MDKFSLIPPPLPLATVSVNPTNGGLKLASGGTPQPFADFPRGHWQTTPPRDIVN